jgi:hypothetical protein
LIRSLLKIPSRRIRLGTVALRPNGPDNRRRAGNPAPAHRATRYQSIAFKIGQTPGDAVTIEAAHRRDLRAGEWLGLPAQPGDKFSLLPAARAAVGEPLRRKVRAERITICSQWSAIALWWGGASESREWNLFGPLRFRPRRFRCNIEMVLHLGFAAL